MHRVDPSKTGNDDVSVREAVYCKKYFNLCSNCKLMWCVGAL